MTDLFSTCLKAPPQSRPADCRKQAPQCLRYPGPLMLLALLLACPSIFAQQNPPAIGDETQASAAGPDSVRSPNTTETLQKATENPVSGLISVPIENKSNFNLGPYDRYQNIVSLKPIFRVQLTKDWNLIARIIQPIAWQPYTSQKGGGEFGFGDMNPTFFLTPAKPGKLIWGAGPTFIIPTATNRILGQGKLSIGPELALFAQPSHWTFGVLISNVWSVAGPGGRPNVNQMQLQYFIDYRLKKGWTLSMSPTLTADWNANTGSVWTVPFGGGVGRIVKFGFQAVAMSAQLYGNAVHSVGASPWSMRFQIAFIFSELFSSKTDGKT